MSKCSLKDNSNLQSTLKLVSSFVGNPDYSYDEIMLQSRNYIQKNLKDYPSFEEDEVSKLLYNNMSEFELIPEGVTQEDIYRQLYVKELETSNPFNFEDEKIDNFEGNSLLENRITENKFGSATNLARKLKLAFTREIVKRCIVDTSQKLDLNGITARLTKYKNELWQDIKSYLKDYFGIEITEDLYNGFEYTGAFRKYRNRILNILTDNGKIDGLILRNRYKSTSSKDIAFSKAYNAFVLLNDFDSLVLNLFKKVIEINPLYLGKFSTDNNKYTLRIGSNITNNWRTTNDVNYEDEIANIVKVIISTIPKVDKNSNDIKDSYIANNDFFAFISKLRNLPKSQLLSSARLDPAKNLKAIMDDIINRLNKIEDLYEDDKMLFRSLYKYIFADKNSLYSIYKNDLSEYNFYNFIVRTIVSTSPLNFTQEKRDNNGNFTVLTLRESSYDKASSNLKNQLNSRFSKLISLYYKNLKKKYSPEYSGDTFSITIEGKKVYIKYYVDSSSVITNPEISDIQVRNFIRDIYGIQFSDEFFNILNSYGTNYRSLLALGTHILSNAYFTHEKADYANLEKLKESAKEYFKKDLSHHKLSLEKGEYDIFSENSGILETNKRIGRAYSTVRGIANRGTLQDSKGNDLGINSPSRLFEGIDSQIIQIKSDSILGGLGILNLFKDYEIFREFADSKNAIEYNANETFYDSLVIDYLGNNLKTHPFVISDKSVVLKAIIDRNEYLKLLKKYNPKAHINNIDKDIEVIHNTIKGELGSYYKRIYDKIISDWNKFSNFLKTKGFNIDINPEHDFYELNNNTNSNIIELLNPYIVEYQQINPSFELTEEYHYVLDRNGKIHFNRNLLSLYYRFNGKLPIDSNYFINFNPHNYEQFVRDSERNLLTDLLNEEFEIDLSQDYPQLKHFRNLSGWIDSKLNTVILGKYENEEGKLINILSLEDMPSEDVNIILNPLIQTFNWNSFLINQELTAITVGSYLVNPAKTNSRNYNNKTYNDYREDEERWNTSTKRNNPISSNMDLYQPSCVMGLPNDIKVASIQQPSEDMFNFVGVKGKADYMDGAIFTAGPSLYLQNNSLGSSRAGLTQKPLFHSLNTELGVASLIKTASFPLSNERCRRSDFNRRMLRKMLSYDWKIYNPNYKQEIDITENFKGERIEWDWYLFDGVNYIHRYNLNKNKNGTYSYNEETVNEYGEVIKKEELPKEVILNNNYDLYLLFGAEQSVSFNQDGKLSNLNEHGEQSNKLLAYAMNMVGYAKDPNNVISQADIKQPLKNAQAHYLVTSGAIKKGIANVNPLSSFKSNAPLAYQTIKLGFSGIQLDKTHETDDSEVSALTQVTNALCAKGYTESQAREVYNALKYVALESIKEYKDVVDYYFSDQSEENLKKVRNAFANIIIDKVIGNKDTVLDAIVYRFNELKRLGILPNANLPISDPSIYNQAISMVTSAVNSMAIRMKFNGQLSVLTPSHNIYKIFGKKQLSEFKSYDALKKEYDSTIEEIFNPLNKGKETREDRINKALKEGVIIRSYKLALGTEYIVYDKDGKQVIDKNGIPVYVNITDPITRSKVRSKYNNCYFKEVWYKTYNRDTIVKGDYYVDKNGDVIQNLGNTFIGTRFEPVGRNLEPYDVYFKGIILEDNGRTSQIWFSLWDLKIVQDAYLKGEKIDDKLQTLLNSIHENKTNTPLEISTIDSKGVQHIITVTPIYYETKPFEQIRSNSVGKKFNIPLGTSLNDINVEFFLKQLESNWDSKVLPSQYDLQLKRLDGNHLNLIFPENIPTSLTKIDINPYIDDAGNIWSLDNVGNKEFKLSSLNDSIYVDTYGNKVIATNNMDFYLGSYRHLYVQVTPKMTDKELAALNSKVKDEKFNKFLDKFEDEKGKLNIEELSSYNPKEKDFERIANKLYASFKLSLEDLAARIPSQSMQSFMACKTIGFDESGLNNVYVSPYQVFLQGSDFTPIY